MDITTILLTIQSLLDNNPLHHEPGLKKSANTNTLYNEIIKYESLNTLLLKNYTDGGQLFVSFREYMDIEINKIGSDKIIDYVKEFCSLNNDSKVIVPIYRINTILSYSLLSNNIGRLKH